MNIGPVTRMVILEMGSARESTMGQVMTPFRQTGGANNILQTARSHLVHGTVRREGRAAPTAGVVNKLGTLYFLEYVLCDMANVKLINTFGFILSYILGS